MNLSNRKFALGGGPTEDVKSRCCKHPHPLPASNSGLSTLLLEFCGSSAACKTLMNRDCGWLAFGHTKRRGIAAGRPISSCNKIFRNSHQLHYNQIRLAAKNFLFAQSCPYSGTTHQAKLSTKLYRACGAIYISLKGSVVEAGVDICWCIQCAKKLHCS